MWLEPLNIALDSFVPGRTGARSLACRCFQREILRLAFLCGLCTCPVSLHPHTLAKSGLSGRGPLVRALPCRRDTGLSSRCPLSFLVRMQLYVVGEVVGMTGVTLSSTIDGASCKWWLVTPSEWRHVSGSQSGVSQCDTPAEAGMFVFGHPVDVCCETTSDDLAAVAMPRIELELRLLDAHGRSDLGGYAVVHVPAAPGAHEMSCPVWRPRGSSLDRFATAFIGGAPQLKDPRLRYGFEDGDGDGQTATRLTRSVGRQRLSTAPMGEVHLRLNVCRKVGTSGEDRIGGSMEEP